MTGDVTHTVYKHVADLTGTVLYVGCTNNLRRRNKEHRESGYLGSDSGVHVEVVGEFPRGEALAIEQALILHYRPTNNRRGLYGATTTAGEFVRVLAEAHHYDVCVPAKRAAERAVAAINAGFVPPMRPIPSRRRSA